MRRKTNTDSDVDYKDPIVRENIARIYQPLIHKIARQQVGRVALCYDDILGYANLGLVDALNLYNPERGASFKQFLSYRILYAIQNGSNTEGHIVRFSAVEQKKRRERGESTWIRESIENTSIENYDGDFVYELQNFDSKDALNSLCEYIDSKFNEKDCSIFYHTFGLNGYKQMKGKDIAALYGCSAPNVSIVVRKIIRYIRGNVDLMSNLFDYLN